MKERSPILSALRSDFEIGTILDVQIDHFAGLTSLPASAFALDGGDAESKKGRAALIEAVRSGKHIALAVTATTWRQRPTPNRRGLRLSPDKLADRAPSWKGKPFLVDHNTYKVMESSKGTILSSRLIEESPRVHSFEQTLEVVKPDAVIGFLDRTLRSFSISWFGLGTVMCTVHGVDVSSSDSCGCWPLETVTVDGRPQIVQYEFSDYEGKETSGVVVGAVQDTSVEEVRSALSAELNLHPARPRTRPPKENQSMAFTKLAAALALTALAESDEDRAVTAVTGLRERAAAAELDAGTLRAENARLVGENTRLSAEVGTAQASAIDSLIADAYKAGKLTHGKDAEGKNTPHAMEDLLREYGKTAGRDKLAAKISALPQIIPIGTPAISTTVKEPERQLRAVPSDEEIRNTALQCGIPEDQLRASYGLQPITRAAGGSQ